MIDAVGTPQSVLLLGGTSEIGLAVVDAYAARRSLRVVLAGRPSERLTAAADRLQRTGHTVAPAAGGVPPAADLTGRARAAGQLASYRPPVPLAPTGPVAT